MAGLFLTGTISAQTCDVPGKPACPKAKTPAKKKVPTSTPGTQPKPNQRKKENSKQKSQTVPSSRTDEIPVSGTDNTKKSGSRVNRNNINVARQFLNAGLKFLKKEEPEYSRAITAFTKSIENKTDFPDAYYYRALANKRLGNSDVAFDDYTEAIRYEPTFADAYNNRAGIFFEKLDFAAALRDYNEAVKYDPYDVGRPIIYLNRGKLYRQLEEYEAAIRDFDEAVKYDVQYAEAYYQRGLVRIAQKKYRDAAEDCGRALGFDPAPSGAAKCREDANKAQKKYDDNVAAKKKALADLRATITEPRTDDDERRVAEKLYDLGNAYLANNKFDEAIENYTEAIALRDKMAIVYLNRGTAHYSKKDYKLAIDDYRQAIDLGLVTYDIHRRKGLAHASRKELDSAIEEYQKAIKLKDDCFDCYFALSNAYIEQGKLVDAERGLTRSVDDLQGRYRDFESNRLPNQNTVNPVKALLVKAYLLRASVLERKLQVVTDEAEKSALKEKADNDRREARKLN